MKVVYACELCSKHFKTIKEARAHEATHFGLTPDEYFEWGRLTGRADFIGKMCAVHRDEHMNNVFDDCVNALVKFEQEHSLVGKEPLDNSVDAEAIYFPCVY